MATEQMSDIVARSHIRATQIQITLLTREASQRRVEFSTLIFKVLSEERNEKAREQSEKQYRRYKGARGSNLMMPMHIFETAGRAGDDSFPIESVRDGEFIREMTRNFGDFPGFADLGPWSCQVCTLMNSGGRFCEACGTRR